MNGPFRVTVVNLDVTAQTAVVNGGVTHVGAVSVAELVSLLETFRGLELIQNLDASPEILVELRQKKYLIRTGQKKLFLYNPRDPNMPAQEGTPTELIAEMDGSAAVARAAACSAAPFMHRVSTAPVADSEIAATRPAASAARASWPLALVALGLASWLGVLLWPTGPGAIPDSFQRIADDTEVASYSTALAGVYLTGSEPGSHGIVVREDGGLKIFQTNAQVAPDVINDVYALGKINGKLCLATNQPGGVIETAGKDLLIYGGERYQRLSN